MTEKIPVVAAVDIGGTKLAAAIASVDGKMLVRFQTTTPREPMEGVEWIVMVLQKWLQDRGRNYRNHALCVGCPGPMDRAGGMILRAPNLESWNEYPLRDELSARLAVPVELENDANLAAIGEHRFGAGIGCRDLVYVTVSTGIGGGLVIGNKLYRGVADSAGEVGHMTIDLHGPACNCGSRGCLEAMASGTAIMHAALERVGNGSASLAMMDLYNMQGNLTAKDIADLAQQGDQVASSLLDQAMTYLGIGISNLITVLSPQRVILGGGVTKIGEQLFEHVRKVVRERVRLVPIEKIAIVPAKLGGDSVLFGGFSLADELSHIRSEE
jgi:glucokinase